MASPRFGIGYGTATDSYCIITVGRVNGLSTRESKRRKIEECTERCSNLVVNMLRVVSVVSCSEERK